MASHVDFEVFDCDNHYYEAIDAFTRHVEPGMAKRTMQWAEIDGKTAPPRRRQGQPLHPQPDLRPGLQARRARRVLPRPQPEGRGRRASSSASSTRSSDRPEYRNRDARLAAHGRAGHGAARSSSRPSASAWSRRSSHDLPALPRRVPRVQPLDGRGLGLRLPGADLRRAVHHAGRPRRGSDVELQWALDHDARFVVMVPGPVITPLGPASPADPVFDPFWVSWRIDCGRHRRSTAATPLPSYLADWGEPTEMEAFRSEPVPFHRVVGPGAGHVRQPARARPVPPVPQPADGVDRDRLRLGVPPLRQADEVVRPDAPAYPEDPRETFRRHVWVSPYYEDELAGLAT